MTQRIEYTEEMVGNAHPTKADTLNRLVNLITAAGGILFGTGVATAEYRILPKFSANKNGTNQTGLISGNPTKVTFTTEEDDIGSAYDAANSKWTPGIVGKAHINACITWVNPEDQKQVRVYIYKNGGLYFGTITEVSGTDLTSSIISRDVTVTAITDYFEIYGYHECSVNKDILGTTTFTWFSGHMLP
jgi:hypothetical protein